jgi:nitroreductase
MDFKDVLQGRRSIRRYQKKELSKEQVQSLIDAAEAAPSAGNLQARRYVVVTNPQMQKALSIAAYGQNQVETAAALVVVCADVNRSSQRYGDRGSLYSIQDATAATMCLLLAAFDQGLGACWTGAFDDQIVREALDMEDRVLPVAIISLGWPAEAPLPPAHRGLSEMVRWIE